MTTADTRLASVIANCSADVQPIAAKQICFVKEAPAGTKPIRKFKQPRDAVAIEADGPLSPMSEASAEQIAAEPIDRCWIIFTPKNYHNEKLTAVQEWTDNVGERGVSSPLIVVQDNGAVVRWRPGMALVQCRQERRQEIVAALAEFAFYEGELRELEAALEGHEAQARADVSIAYQIQSRDQKHWIRFRQAIEYFSRIRLTYARLEPVLVKGSRGLPVPSRRIVSSLFREADVEDRLEALNNRLEVLEDLYEGANDRVADFRSYRNGALLEIVITSLLLVETIIIALDLYTRYR